MTQQYETYKNEVRKEFLKMGEQYRTAHKELEARKWELVAEVNAREGRTGTSNETLAKVMERLEPGQRKLEALERRIAAFENKHYHELEVLSW